VGRTERIVGVALVAAGAVALLWQPVPSPRPGSVLVLLDDETELAPPVYAAFAGPGPWRDDDANFRVRTPDTDSSNAISAVATATRTTPYDAVVVVTAAGDSMDVPKGSSIGSELAANGVSVSVVLAPPAPSVRPPPVLQPARPVRVLCVEQSPRWEFHFLTAAMCRDENVLAHTWLADAEGAAPQRRTQRDDWPAIDLRAGFPSAADMDRYDVLVLGDVEPDALRGPDAPGRDVAAEVRAWVESGRGLLVIAGPQHMPIDWTKSALADVLPVVVSAPLQMGPRPDPSEGFRFRLTAAGAASPLLDVADETQDSQQLWQTSPKWEMYWAAPVKVREGATELVQAGTGAYEGRTLVASGTCGKGRVLFVGVDELWRIRVDVGDLFFWRFYAGAIGWLAEPRVPLVPAPEVKAPEPEPRPDPPGVAALRALAAASGGRVCGVEDAAGLAAALRRTRAPAAPASREPWAVAAGALAVLCGVFFLLRPRGT
jgi:hypothetical protein